MKKCNKKRKQTFNNFFVYAILIVLYVSSDAAEVCDVLAR